MKIAALLLCLVFASMAAAQDTAELGRANIVRIWDHRISDLHARPIEIRDRAAIAELAASIGSASGDWRQGSFTMPTGYLMIAFWHDEQVIARFGLGEEFLVRGSMEDWQSKPISKALELRLAKYAEKRPNQAPEPTTTLVTIRAYARLAPSAVVAHL